MKIVVNDIAASCGGAMTILKQFYNYIKDNDNDNEWIFLLGDNYLEETEKIKVICFPKVKNSWVNKILFDCFYGRRVIGSYKPDVVVSLQNIITFGLKIPRIVYVHQSIPFQNIKRFSFFKKAERKTAFIQYVIGAFIKVSVKKATKVFVQTQWMKKAVLESCNIPNEKVFVSFPDVKLFSPQSEKFKNNKFFYPTNSQIYKNIDTILNACDVLNGEGISDFSVRLTLPEGSVQHSNVECIGTLNHEQMQEEYSSGTLLFPSYIETVGLPLLEARSCGTMVIASDLPFAHECLDGYGNTFFCRFDDAGGFADSMKAIIKKEVVVSDTNTFSVNGRSSWEHMYKEILNAESAVFD